MVIEDVTHEVSGDVIHKIEYHTDTNTVISRTKFEREETLIKVNFYHTWAFYPSFLQTRIRHHDIVVWERAPAQ
jgi:hypothetical protein